MSAFARAALTATADKSGTPKSAPIPDKDRPPTEAKSIKATFSASSGLSPLPSSLISSVSSHLSPPLASSSSRLASSCLRSTPDSFLLASSSCPESFCTGSSFMMSASCLTSTASSAPRAFPLGSSSPASTSGAAALALSSSPSAAAATLAKSPSTLSSSLSTAALAISPSPRNGGRTVGCGQPLQTPPPTTARVADIGTDSGRSGDGEFRPQPGSTRRGSC
mmetsp:Transcript_130478/g.338281  ORF Transcript_130478/g.338281 Transcript_130478/m.338281 type:complete len:222 (+) Transcript_130478:330-995(+)